MSTTTGQTGIMHPFASCGHCGNWHSGPCPRVKAMEYYPNGTIKRVEYFDATPVAAPGGPPQTITIRPPEPT